MSTCFREAGSLFMRIIIGFAGWLALIAFLFAAAVFSGAEIPANPAASFAARSDDGENKFACLPKDVRLDEIVRFDIRGGKNNLDVNHALLDIKARCHKGKLVDAKRREIRFFRPECWGNPPADYQEIRRKESADLANLKKRYTVIVFGCSPMIP